MTHSLPAAPLNLSGPTFLVPTALLSLVAVCLVSAGPALGQETVTLLETVQREGTLKSVGAGLIELTDSAGQVLKCKIQDKDQTGVSLTGLQSRLRYPAQVRVSGTQSLDSLAPGTPVSFTAKLNRQGRTEGSLDKLLVLDEKQPPRGVEIQTPAEGQGYATCTVSGEVVSVRNNRLQVSIPKSDFVRTQRLVFPLADEVLIALETDDYHRARAGDQARIVAARFSTGDIVIKELTITLAPRGKERSKTPPSELSKYRQLSDAPSPPRDVRSAHFVLHTDISDRSAKMLLDKLEYMLGIVAQYYARPPAGVIECYVVRDVKQWPEKAFPPDALAKILEPAGIALSVSVGQNTRSVVYSCDKDGVVQHEAVHAYCSQTFGSTGPTWYSEGMAEMGHYWKKDQLAVDLDPVAMAYLRRGPRRNMLEIVAAGQITGDSWENYCWRWALCYMLATNSNYSGQFRGLGVAMMSKQPGASFEATYGPVAKQIAFEYDQFCQNVNLGYRSDLCAWQWNRKFQYLRGDGNVSTSVLAKYGWQGSGVKLKAGQACEYVAKGTWKFDRDAEAVDADGLPDGTGKLVGCLFQDYRLSQPFDLGTKGTFVASQDGDLYLRCRDEWTKLGQHEGSLTVYFRRPSAQ